MINSPGKSLTLQEVALLAGVSEKKIRHELEERVVTPERDESRLRFPARSVLFFRVAEAVPLLSKEDRRNLYVLVTKKRRDVGPWKAEARDLVRRGEVTTRLETSEVRKKVAQLLWTYVRGKRRVVSSDDVLSGEPVFAGTRISVRHVGALAEKLSLEELRREFPRLRDEDFEFAKLYARLPSPPGRPPKRLEFRRRARPRNR